MALSSYKSSGTCADDSSVGTISWLQSDASTALAGTEVSSDDDVYAAFQGESAAVTHYLKCTNFGFTSSDVPSGATILGFEIEVRQFRNSGPTVTSTTVKLVKGGTISGNNIGASVDWDATETAVVYGNSSQLGGLSWTQSDITSSNFGCAISVSLASARVSLSGASHFIDQVRVRVYYSDFPTLTGVSSITGIASVTF